MATITRKGGAKKGVKSASKKVAAAKKVASSSTRRSTEDIDALVPDIVKALQGGAKMNEVKETFGFSHGQPIRQALARNGFDSKGNELAVEQITGSGKSLAGKIAKEREQGAAWYILARRTGKTEGELKALLEEHGFSVEGRTYAPRAESSSKATGAKKGGTAAKKGGAKKGRKIARKAAADPSPQA